MWLPTKAEVVSLISQIESIIQNAELPDEVAMHKARKYIETAKIEAEESEPDKQLISKNIEVKKIHLII